MIYPKSIWGPKAWNLLHSYSFNNNCKIPNNKKHNYYIFYTSFTYLIPCIICKEHYSDIIQNINPLIEENIDRKYLIKWLYNTHNIVNEFINKPKYSYKKFINNKKINHIDNYFTLYTIYSVIDYKSISLYNYDQIYNFFINFCKLYPDIEKRKKLKKLIEKRDFNNIITPIEFNKWFKLNITTIKNIICV